MSLFKKKNIVTLSVPDISCGHCEMKIQNAISGMRGVEKVKPDHKKKTVTLELSGDETADMNAITESLSEAGYPVAVE
ncbi:MAG: heavy-metal-associated domain-containing protein [Spirochaeta sp.]|nr:heavy-metal-associated domain-containing protein [Spirochaeta sp.]